MARRKQTATIDLKVRMKEPLRAALEVAAKRRGISLNSEAVDRLDRTFHNERLLNEVLALKYGNQLAGMLRMIGDAMMEVGPQEAFNKTASLEEAENWLNHPTAVATAKQAAVHIIDALLPGAAAAESSKTLSMAQGYAKSIIQHVMGRGGNEYTKHDEAEIRALLGPLAKNLKVN